MMPGGGDAGMLLDAHNPEQLGVVPWGMIAFVTPVPVPAASATSLPGWLLNIVDIAPLITLLVAIAAIIPAWVAISRNGKSNRQGRWWSETQWALDASFGQDVERKKAGIRMLKILATEKWLGEHELQVLDAAWLRPIEAASGGRSIDVPVATADNGISSPQATVDSKGKKGGRHAQ